MTKDFTQVVFCYHYPQELRDGINRLIQEHPECQLESVTKIKEGAFLCFFKERENVDKSAE